MADRVNAWLNWQPKTSIQTTDKTDKTTFVSFVSNSNERFQGRIESKTEQKLVEKLDHAIELISGMWFDGADELIASDRVLATERRRIAALPLRTVSEVDHWADRWRILMAEARIESTILNLENS